MSTATIPATATPRADTAVLSRILREGYGPGAWHGPDMKAALADVSAPAAFWRPSPGRHNIAEIALHHAYVTRGVRAKLSAEPIEPFVLDGDDWFELPDESRLRWSEVQSIVEREQAKLVALVTSREPGGAETFDLVLGVTCHGAYHAGQIQLLKRLREG